MIPFVYWVVGFLVVGVVGFVVLVVVIVGTFVVDEDVVGRVDNAVAFVVVLGEHV